MREPKYLSPSGLGCWLQDRDEYYKRYLADERWPRDPQTQPMAAGSAFDAYVKAYLYKELRLGEDASFELEALLQAQVDEGLLPWARDFGSRAFEWYREIGGLADIMLLCNEGDVRMEFEVRSLVGPGVGVEAGPGVTFMGKPDLVIYRQGRRPVIIDWKVNGACAKRAPSPRPGYIMTRGYRGGAAYKGDTVLRDEGGDMRNVTRGITGDWGRQLAIYSWCMGASVGEEWLCGVDQLCMGADPGRWRLAQHRSVVPSAYQHETYASAVECWGLEWVDDRYARFDAGPMPATMEVPAWLT